MAIAKRKKLPQTAIYKKCLSVRQVGNRQVQR